LGNDQLLQFYSTKTSELGLAIWPTNPDDVSAKSITAEVGLNGPLLQGSSLAGVVNQEKIKVFGLIQKAGNDNNCNCNSSVAIAQVSPAMSLVTDLGDSCNYGNHLAVAKKSDDEAWLFFIGMVEDSDSDTHQMVPTLQMVAIHEISDVSQPSNDMEPALKSYLAAYYSASAGSIYLIYQLKSGHIRELVAASDDPDKSGSNALVDNSTTTKKLSPLAACIANNGVYLYFLNTNNVIYRVFKSSDGWGNATIVSRNSQKTTDGSSPLAAVSDAETDPNKKSNTLFYVAKGSTTYTRFTDKWI